MMKLSERFIRANNDLCDFGSFIPAPYFRKSFMLDFQPDSAEITICGLGFYELYINGSQITKGPLAPYISNTDDVCFYDSYDIAKLLKKGENVVGVLLGNGMRNAYGGFIWEFDKASSRGPVTLAICLEASGEGKRMEFCADESFKTHPSPILYDDLRMGYCYDARLEVPGWDKPGFDDSAWANAIDGEAPKGIKKLCQAEPITKAKEIQPVEIKKYNRLPFAYFGTTPDALPREETIRENVYVFDFGINTAGVTRLKINGSPGQKITVRHGEYLQGGRFSVNTTCFLQKGRPDEYISRYLNYAQTDVFICKGGEEIFEPKFKYDGFRYAYVEGLLDDQIADDTLILVEMNSDLSEKGSFTCSDDSLNRLQENCRRSDLSNFYYFPTDCPHREKNGWTGDVQVSAEHMLINLTAEKSLREWLLSLRLSQSASGDFPGIVPTGGWGYGHGPCWDSVSVYLPYFLYKYTGDKSVISENSEMMMRYLTYAMTLRDARGIIPTGLGDWADPFRHYNNGKIAAPVEVTSTFTVYDIAKKASFLFHQAELWDYAKTVSEFADVLYADIRRNLIDFETMTVLGSCQTAQVLGIAFGIFTEKELPAARARLMQIIHAAGDINTCGMVGIRYLFHVLSDMGEAELAYHIITSKARSCYGYWLANGATTMWESFRPMDNDAVDSRNHHFMCDISSWFIQALAGLKPNPHADDIRYFEISPNFIKQLDFAKAEYMSVCGKVSVSWKRRNGKFLLGIELPEGTSGDVILKGGYRLFGGADRIHLEGKSNVMLTLYSDKEAIGSLA